MSENKSSGIFIDSVKTLFKTVLRLLFILIAWLMRFVGMALTKTGEIIEKLIVKKSTL